MTAKYIGMWPSVSSASRNAPAFVVIGNPGSRRVTLFQQALAGLGLPPASEVAYADLLSGAVALPEVAPEGAVIRIESPGKDLAVEQALLVAGGRMPDPEGFAWIEAEQARQLVIERGQIVYPRQWYRGLCAMLQLLQQQRAACRPHTLMNHPDDIAVMFDKRRCHAVMVQAGICVPESPGPVRDYAELLEAMRKHKCPRVFIKLAHGSSASGVVAYQISGNQHHATTTVEMVRANGALRLYNSRRIRVYRDAGQIAELIDELCRHCVHVERWLPKAGIDNQTFDLRVMVIGGVAQHVVARLSRSPMTNLHLLNERGDPAAVQARMGPAAWQAAMRTCERAAECFPDSLYAGIDLLINTGYTRHAVLELNAFGDLLPGILLHGVDTYTAEILSTLAKTKSKTP